MNKYNVFVLNDCKVKLAARVLAYPDSIDGHSIDENHTAFFSKDGQCIIAEVGESVREGFSDLRSEGYTFGYVPDGKGGWVAPEPAPTPDAQSAQKWKLATVLATKGITFTPADTAIAARWQYEPSFAIDGVVAEALRASLGYDEAQLQTLFNEAAALK